MLLPLRITLGQQKSVTGELVLKAKDEERNKTSTRAVLPVQGGPFSFWRLGRGFCLWC